MSDPKLLEVPAEYINDPVVHQLLEQAVAEERRDIAFYRESLQRIAEASGILDPIQLIAKAENNEQTYVDILVKHIAALNARERKP